MSVALFLTSKVRLHCDFPVCQNMAPIIDFLFLTSKVRLHCDVFESPRATTCNAPFS